MRHIFLSPHFDDVVGSCGGLIADLTARGENVTVITIFSGLPKKRPKKAVKMLRRRYENYHACKVLKADLKNLGFLEAIYRGVKRVELFDEQIISESTDITNAIQQAINDDDIIYVPAGLGNHIDHRIVKESVAELKNKKIYYEEFFYDWRDKKTLPGFSEYKPTESGLDKRLRAVLKYKLEIHSLFKGAECGYFAQRKLERYSEVPVVPQIIVSLTSFPERIPLLHLVLQSILVQKLKADKILLYLARPQFKEPNLEGQLSRELLEMEKSGVLEIRFEEDDIRSFKKLIPAMRDFPNDKIITIDDDILYPNYMMEFLLKSNRKYPRAISGMRVRRVKYDGSGFPLKYKQWRLFRLWRILYFGKKPDILNFATTGGGTLFPPAKLNLLHSDVAKKEIFTKLCPTTDDIWFWVMAVLNGTKTAVARRDSRLEKRQLEVQQKCGLWRENIVEGDKNNENIKALFEMYPQLRKILRGEYTHAP